MLYPAYYIINSSALQQRVPLKEDDVCAMHLESFDKAYLITAYQTASNLFSNTRFCVSINAFEDIGKSAIDIVAFFFLPNYSKQNAALEVIVRYNQQAQLETCKDELKKYAAAQGIDGIKWHEVQAEKVISVTSEHELEAVKEPYQALLNGAGTEGALYISVLQPSLVGAIAALLEKEEQLFAKQNRNFYAVKQQNKNLQKRLLQSMQIHKAAEQELGNLASHISILRSGSQAVHLQHYYNNEYEVLPLWYKRFGHIIKALTGKRTFRSLLNDKEKKYRQ